MFEGVVWGLDVSSKGTGLCVGAPGAIPTFEHVDFSRPDDDPLERAAQAVRWVVDRTSIAKPAFAYIEAPLDFMAQGTNPQTALLLKGLYMVIGGILVRRGVQVRPAKVQTVRKHFIGHGNLKGDTAKRLVRDQCRLLGWNPPNNDCSDAAAVWHFGCNKVAADRAPKPEPIAHMREAA